MGASLLCLQISESIRRQLERLRVQRTAKASLVFRAELILLAAAGHSNAEIARRLRCTPHVVGKWRTRFESGSIDALADQQRTGRPQTHTEKERKLVVLTVCSKPPKGFSRWSVRTLARHLGIAQTSVHRILRAHD